MSFKGSRDRDEEDTQEDRKRRKKSGWDVDVPPSNNSNEPSLIRDAIQAALNVSNNNAFNINAFNVSKPTINKNNRIYVGYDQI